jgi:hypothetical protein
MRRFTFLLVAVATIASFVALVVPAPGHADGQPAPPFVTEIPHGYRDWRWISSAHEAGNLNSLGAVLGNDVAINAFREGKLPFPDGTIIAALHYRNVPSEENNKVFSIFRSRGSHEHSVYGQGLHKVRLNRRLGLRPLRKRQTWGRGVYEKLLPLPPEGQSDRPCVYTICTLMLKTRAERSEKKAAHKASRVVRLPRLA